MKSPESSRSSQLGEAFSRASGVAEVVVRWFTHSELRVNGLVGDIVGNVLDLGIVFTVGRRHDGRSRLSGGRGREVAVGGGSRSNCSKRSGTGAGGERGSKADASQLLGGRPKAPIDSRHG